MTIPYEEVIKRLDNDKVRKLHVIAAIIGALGGVGWVLQGETIPTEVRGRGAGLLWM